MIRRRTLAGSLIAVALLAGLLALVLRERAEPATRAVAAQPAPASGRALAPGVEPAVAGPEAAEIQAGVRDFLRLAEEAERREDAERDALLNPPGSEGATIDQRLELFQQVVQSRTSGIDPARILPYRSALTEVFLRVDAVQRELAALAPADREQQLARIRRELGYGDAEIQQLAREDAVKEGRWQNGRAYMEERRRLAATFEGETLEQELDVLRTRYFAVAARTIEREEQAGFFRFERPRIYGRN